MMNRTDVVTEAWHALYVSSIDNKRTALMLQNYVPRRERKRTYTKSKDKRPTRVKRIRSYPTPSIPIVNYVRELVYSRAYTQKSLAGHFQVSATMFHNFLTYKPRKYGWSDLEQKILMFACSVTDGLSSPLSTPLDDVETAANYTNFNYSTAIVLYTQQMQLQQTSTMTNVYNYY